MLLAHEELDLTEKQVTLDCSICADLGADSLQNMEIILGLEDEFDVSIPDDDIGGLETVQDVVRYIDSLTWG